MLNTVVAVVLRRRRLRVFLLALLALAMPFGIAGTPAFAQATNSVAAPFGPLQLGSVPIAGEEPNYVELGAGAYGLIYHDSRYGTAAGDVEFKFGDKLLYLGPAFGVIADPNGAGMVYATLYTDFDIGSIVITPMGGVGAYWRGDRQDLLLGGTFQFRLSLEAAYQFADQSRIGLRFGHISSAGLNHVNPGDEELMVTYSIPVGR